MNGFCLTGLISCGLVNPYVLIKTTKILITVLFYLGDGRKLCVLKVSVMYGAKIPSQHF